VTLPSRITRHAQTGVTLIELLVGIVLGMVAVIVILQVFQVSEGSKRTTLGGDDAQINGAIAIAALQRDLRQAGYGTSAFAFVGCDVNLPGGRTVPGIGPVTINHPNVPAGDANTDTLLVVYGSSAGSPEGDRVNLQPATETYAVATPTAFAVGDLVLAAPASRPSPCTITAEPVTGVTVSPPYVTVAAGVAGMSNGTLYNLGPALRVLAYAVRDGNLTVCDHLAANCMDDDLAGNRTVWVPVSSGIVSLRAQYGRDSSAPMDGAVDVYDRTTPASACAWARTSALRLTLVARSAQFEKEAVTTAPPTWSGSGDEAAVIDLSELPDWQRYRYRTYETTVPLRNMAWQGVQSGC
jgi:type IV pilus assembly protein PilW